MRPTHKGPDTTPRFSYICSSEVGRSCSVSSCSSDNFPSLTKSSTGALSEKSLSAFDSILEILSLLEAFSKVSESEPVVKAGLGWSVRGRSVRGGSVSDVLVAGRLEGQ